MADELWTWDEQAHPNIPGVLSAPAADLGWCDRLETAPSDATVGKVLCVCAAAAIASEVLAAHGGDAPEAVSALQLLDRWIDDPTAERFESICALIFGEDESPDFGPHGIVWWALRTATSSVGNYEGGWALSSTCGAAECAGFSPEHLRKIAERAVLTRQRRAC